LLLSEQLKGEDEDGKGINDEELIDEIKTFVIAGSETTSNFLTAMLLFTFEKPAIASRLIG
jgi:cytochrome P450